MNHTFVITFTEGEHQGETVPVREALLLGRSREAGVRFTAPDTSGKHIRLEDRDGELVLVQVGSGKTSLNGDPVAPGAARPLKVGDSVMFAGGNVFSVEKMADDEVEDPPTAAAPTDGEDLSATRVGAFAPQVAAVASDTGNRQDSATASTASEEDEEEEGVTQGEVTGTLDSENGTQVLGTLAYTPEVEEALARRHKVAARKRITIASVIAVTVLVVIGIGAWLSQNRHENPLTWPLGVDGRPVFFNKMVDIGDPALEDTFGFFTPGSTALKVHEQPDGVIVETRVGKRQDVPARFVFERARTMENLAKNRERGFADWREKKIAEGWRFEVLPGNRFSGRDSGVPYQLAKYTRGGGDAPWSGFVQYMKFRDWEFAVLAEVPDAEWYRGEKVLSESTYYLMRPSFVAVHWEPDGIAVRRSLEDILNDVEKVLAPEETPGQMLGTVTGMLRSALTLALAKGDETATVRGTKLLQELRRRQTIEFNDRLREFELANGTRQIKRARGLRTTFLSVFNDENDKRFYDLRSGSLLELGVE